MSSSPARCEHNRIHRHHTDIDCDNKCQVETIPLWTPKPRAITSSSQTSQAAPVKRGRGRPRKQPVTPPDEPVNFSDTEGYPSSPLEPHSRLLSRPLGSLFTPQATQEEPPFMALDDEAVSSTAPAEKRFPGALQHTPGGTSFVQETPVGNAPAPAPTDPEPVVNDFDTPNPPSPVPEQNGDEHRSTQLQHDLLQAELENDHLRRSRAAAIDELEDSNALVNRLQVRRRIHEAELAVYDFLLGQTRQDRDAADGDAKNARRQAKRVKQRLGSVFGVLLVFILAYLLWCWYKAPEMEYIRQRREAVLYE